MTLEEQQRLKLKQLRSIIPQAQKLVRSQLEKVRRSGHYPVALEKAVGNAEVSGRKQPDLTSVNPNKLNIYEAQILFASLKSALLAETSSVGGALRVEQAQDRMLFGTSRAGRAKHRMSYDERKSFWSFYDEFLNQNPKYLYAYRQVMSELVDFYMEEGAGALDYQDIMYMAKFKALYEVHDVLDMPHPVQVAKETAKKYASVKRSGENVLSGHRNRRKK